MNKKEVCKHVYGFITKFYDPNESRLITDQCTQVNGNDIVQYYKFCPKCGKQHDFSVFLTEHYFKRMLENKVILRKK